MAGVQKIVHIEVFDFDTDSMAYAVDSQKNQFGYKYRVEYVKDGEVVREDPEVNNVERGAFYYKKFGINLSQLGSLKRRVNSLKRKKKMIPFPEENGVNAQFRGGSNIHYSGNNTEEFEKEVLGYTK